MPPTIGAAIGFMTSDPIPDSQSIGARLRITAVTGHQFWAQPLDRAIDSRLFEIGLRQKRPLSNSVLQSFVEVDDHHHSGLHCDPKKSDVADPYGHAEVVAKQPIAGEARLTLRKASGRSAPPLQWQT